MPDLFCTLLFNDKNSHESFCIRITFDAFTLISKHEKWKLFVKSELHSICRTCHAAHLKKKKSISCSMFVVCQVICHIYVNFVQKCLHLRETQIDITIHVRYPKRYTTILHVVGNRSQTTGPRLEPKVIWSERYFSANNIHKGNVKIYKSKHTYTHTPKREREKGFNVFHTMYNRKSETIDCL